MAYENSTYGNSPDYTHPTTPLAIISNYGKTKVPAPTSDTPEYKPAAPEKLGKFQAPDAHGALRKWLAGDDTYQQQLADFMRTRQDYQANYQRQYGQVNQDYYDTQRSLLRQGRQDRIDQQNDFAGRGILRSGVFAKALGDYNTQFNQRMDSLIRGRTNQLGDLDAQRQSFLRQVQEELNAAKQDAIRRRAAQLGI